MAFIIETRTFLSASVAVLIGSSSLNSRIYIREYLLLSYAARISAPLPHDIDPSECPLASAPLWPGTSNRANRAVLSLMTPWILRPYKIVLALADSHGTISTCSRGQVNAVPLPDAHTGGDFVHASMRSSRRTAFPHRHSAAFSVSQIL